MCDSNVVFPTSGSELFLGPVKNVYLGEHRKAAMLLLWQVFRVVEQKPHMRGVLPSSPAALAKVEHGAADGGPVAGVAQ